ncbi:MAG TPA: TMEM175 family protein [Lacisediminihabitans sp.]|jgi:uncharacterized membrane protein|nr:TMEM175 family protein [Lacisediminihabitans sp.]HXD60458.1 TMEM175 family protein [Lacisediminihabitans sp.]
MATIRTDRGLSRLVGFSDAAVAIALTLLVLPLVDIAPEIAKPGGVGRLFIEHWSAFLAFAISFAVIARFWVVHHRVFDLVSGYTPLIVWVNFVWLASIVFLPFATNVLSYSPTNDRGVYALYIGTLFLTSGSMLLMEVVLKRTPELLRRGAQQELDVSQSAIATALFVVALILAVVVPAVGMFWLLLLLGAGLVRRLVRRVFRRPAAG